MRKKHSPNKWRGRRGYYPEAIVIHICEGGALACLNHTMNPKSEKSYHFIVKPNEVIQTVPIKDSAWHAGKSVRSKWVGLRRGVNHNRYTVGIACTGLSTDKLPFSQLVRLCATIAYVSSRTNIKITPQTVIPHKLIRTDKTCPGRQISNFAYVTFSSFLLRSNWYKRFL